MKQFVAAVMISIGSLSPLALGNGADIVTSPAKIQTLLADYQNQLESGSVAPSERLTPVTASLIHNKITDEDFSPSLVSMPVEDYYLLLQEAKGLNSTPAEEDQQQLLGLQVHFDPESYLLFIVTEDGEELWMQPASTSDELESDPTDETDENFEENNNL
ncbi:MAG: hypothetical protein ACOH5I_09865 [Oligoflexus sp.]